MVDWTSKDYLDSLSGQPAASMRDQPWLPYDKLQTVNGLLTLALASIAVIWIVARYGPPIKKYLLAPARSKTLRAWIRLKSWWLAS
jgi:hypothetical protein